MSLEVVFIVPNGVDPDEMQHYAAFNLDLHCSAKNPFSISSIQRVHDQNVLYGKAHENLVLIQCKHTDKCS